MARLNETTGQQTNNPPTMYSAETVEALRRKMLRQNRELARTNSTQAIRLRQLEGECNRMLSENMTLQARIISLEREIEDSKETSLNDHALHIKAQLELRLADMSDLLSTLGSEPPTKRRMLEKHKTKTATAVSRRRQSGLQNMAKILEEQALEEGRLAPIMENNTYPRRSITPEPIDSPQHPIASSPFVMNSPRPSAFADDDFVPETPTKTIESVTQRRKKTREAPTMFKDLFSSPPPEIEPVEATDAVLETVPMPPPRTGKRKHSSDVLDDITPAEDNNENIAPTRRIKTKKEATRKDTLPKTAESNEAPRKPLAVKNINKDMSTSRLTEKTQKGEKDVVHKITELDKPVSYNNARSRKRDQVPKTILVDASVEATPEPTPVAIIAETVDLTEPETTSNPPPHDSVEREGSQDRGSLPPATVSQEDENSRPSRRARSAVSYAEPSLRDKMRRPTKALFDAVAGEGKYMRRVSASNQDGLDPFNQSAARRSMDSATSRSTEPTPEPAAALVDVAARSDADGEDNVSTSLVTDRRKRRSSAAWNMITIAAPVTTSVEPIEVGTKADPYKLLGSPKSQKPVRRRGSSSTDDAEHMEKPVKGSKKRATMSASKRSRVDMEASLFDSEESEVEIASSRSRVSTRRKSTVT